VPETTVVLSTSTVVTTLSTVAPTTTSVVETTTIDHADSCESFCIKAGYLNGGCMRTASDCRQSLRNAVYKERGNKYCPKNTPSDYCCCIVS
jgi:hypothetical protein